MRFLARFIGKYFVDFKGKDKIVQLIYNSEKFKNFNSGHKFIDSYFGFKYSGITSDLVDWGVYVYGGFEKAIINFFLKEAKKVNYEYFIDIGANVGSFSLPFAKKIKIICFEPLKANFDRLINNFEINNLKTNHEFHRLALSDKDGITQINYKSHQGKGAHASLVYTHSEYDRTENISIRKLDHLINFREKYLMIKIDVEGHETNVVDGAINLLKQNKIVMYIETANEILLEKLTKIGFKVFFPKIFYSKLSFVSTKIVVKEKGHLWGNVILRNF